MAFVPVLSSSVGVALQRPARACNRTSLRTSSFHGQRSHVRRTAVRVGAMPSHALPPERIHAPMTMNISSNDFRNGTTIEMEGVPYRVLEFLHVKPGKGAAFVRTKLKNMRTGGNIDKTFKAGEMVQQAQMEKITAQHTYTDEDDYVFMNIETYEEERLGVSALGENVVKFLKIGQEVDMLKYNGEVLDVDMPKSITFEITETEPGAKGNTAQGNALKRAIIETGAEVMVPLFINQGEQIKVAFPEGTYAGRSNE